ncbi:MAG: hypothetical protein HZB50_01995 [Chloroflexi bacterium]|nr:hypothetical protein [Chloroflexota bacterium]
MSKLGPDEIQSLLQSAEDSFPHGACNTCECFLGYLAQLRIDSDSAAKDLFIPFKVERKDMHKCLGCDPCPPGDLYAGYMLKKQKSTLITL